MQDKLKHSLPYILILFLGLVPIFGFLDGYPIQHWDEAQLAVNAQEMNRNGNYLVTYYQGEPDMWNTKPPFMIWCQVLMMKCIGENEIAVRLPSAIAAILTCFLLIYFSRKYLKKDIFGFISALVLISSFGYIELHATRTGDYDAMVSLFTTAYCLFYFLFLETKQRKYVYLFALGFTLAVLTKASVGLFFFLPLAIYTLIRKKISFVFTNKHTYIAVFSGFFLIAAYYLSREYLNPGYLAAVLYNDLFGRFSSPQEGHSADFLFYFKNLKNYQYTYWLLFALAALPLGLVLKDKIQRKLTQFLALCILGFLCIITLSETKIDWYAIPLFPLLALLSTIFIYFIYDFFKNLRFAQEKLSYNIVPYIVVCIIFIIPYRVIFDKTYKQGVSDKVYFAYSMILQKAIRDQYDVKEHRIVYEGHKSYYLFYVNILKQKGVDIDFAPDKESLENVFGKKLIVQQESIKEYIENEYVYDKIDSIEEVSIYKVYGRR